MVQSAVLGFPRIGEGRAMKKVSLRLISSLRPIGTDRGFGRNVPVSFGIG